MPNITYTMVVLNRLEEMQFALRRVSPWVDKTCVVDGGSTDGTIEWLASEEAKQLHIDFKVSKQVRLQYGNHTPGERDQYLKMAGNEGWILYTDSDEFLEENACRDIYNLVNRAEATGHDCISFNAWDYWTYEDGQIYDNVSNYWNTMLTRSFPGQGYAGHTHSALRRPGAKNRCMQSGYKYQHVKTERRMWQNSTYLFWTTYGEATNNASHPTWLKFHEMMKKYGYLDWHEFNKVMNAGTVPEEIVNWFIEHRDANNSEERAWFVDYLIFKHPELNTNKISNKDKQWDYVEQSRIKRENLILSSNPK